MNTYTVNSVTSDDCVLNNIEVELGWMNNWVKYTELHVHEESNEKERMY